MEQINSGGPGTHTPLGYCVEERTWLTVKAKRITLLVQIRDLLGDIALCIAKSETYSDQAGGVFCYGRPFRYFDTFRRIESEQNRLAKEHDGERSRLEEEGWFQELIEEEKKYVVEKGYPMSLLKEYSNQPEKWRSNDGRLMWEDMVYNRCSGYILHTALRIRGRL